MQHYICTGSCKGEARSEGICEAEFCSKESQPLAVCSCEDGLHEGAGEKSDDSEDIRSNE